MHLLWNSMGQLFATKCFFLCTNFVTLHGSTACHRHGLAYFYLSRCIFSNIPQSIRPCLKGKFTLKLIFGMF